MGLINVRFGCSGFLRNRRQKFPPRAKYLPPHRWTPVAQPASTPRDELHRTVDHSCPARECHARAKGSPLAQIRVPRRLREATHRPRGCHRRHHRHGDDTRSPIHIASARLGLRRRNHSLRHLIRRVECLREAHRRHPAFDAGKQLYAEHGQRGRLFDRHDSLQRVRRTAFSAGRSPAVVRSRADGFLHRNPRCLHRDPHEEADDQSRATPVSQRTRGSGNPSQPLLRGHGSHRQGTRLDSLSSCGRNHRTSARMGTHRKGANFRGTKAGHHRLAREELPSRA